MRRGQGARERGAGMAVRLFLAGTTALAACEGSDGATGGPRLSVAWIGSDTGSMAGPVRVEWCDSLRLLEIRGVHGDTGVALAVYPVAEVKVDSYPIVAPGGADSLRPAAAAGVRWFAETAVRGFQGEEGAVILERADGRVAGRFHGSLRSVTDGRTLTFSGSWRDAPVRSATRGCMARRPAEPEDSSVD